MAATFTFGRNITLEYYVYGLCCVIWLNIATINHFAGYWNFYEMCFITTTHTTSLPFRHSKRKKSLWMYQKWVFIKIGWFSLKISSFTNKSFTNQKYPNFVFKVLKSFFIPLKFCTRKASKSVKFESNWNLLWLRWDYKVSLDICSIHHLTCRKM